jgi:hypothetical protein
MDDELTVNNRELTPVNTGATGNHGHFVKGDPRINRKGRPRTFEAFRKLAIKIAGEDADAEDVTRAVLMLREMSRSKNPADRALFLAYAYGKPRDELDITSAGEKIGKDDTDTKLEILRKLDSIAAATGAESADNQPDAETNRNPGA